MNKITDNEIIKALECCISDDEGTRKRPCNGCPLLQDEACSNSLRKFAFALINRLQAEINVKKKLLDKAEISLLKKEDTMQLLNKEHQKTFDELQKAKAENERLQEYNENLQTANTALSNEILDIKSEARKEFAEQLKNKFQWQHDDYSFTIKTFRIAIDNLLEEMEREEH